MTIKTKKIGKKIFFLNFILIVQCEILENLQGRRVK